MHVQHCRFKRPTYDKMLSSLCVVTALNVDTNRSQGVTKLPMLSRYVVVAFSESAGSS